jgi:predicted RNase H-like nuclease (RuvC/YqgF family)
MATIKTTSTFRTADRLARVDANKGVSSVTSITNQVGNTEVILQNLRQKLEQTTSELTNLEQIQPNPKLYTRQQLSKLFFIERTVKTLQSRLSRLTTRLSNLKRIPERLVNSALALLTATTILKTLPIPGTTLTAGATSTFSATLEDLRIKGRTLLNTAQTIDSVVDLSPIEQTQQQLLQAQQKVDTIKSDLNLTT